MVSAILEKSGPNAFDEDITLIERFLGGDQDAFEGLYHKYREKVFAIAKGILGDPEEAADTVQEVFTLVYRNLSRFDRRARFSTWLFRVAVNRSIQEARKHKHRPKPAELHEASTQEAAPPPAEADPRVEAAMSKLAPADRALLVLFYWEELSLIEIAESLGCSANAAKTRLYRARERFRVLFEREEE